MKKFKIPMSFIFNGTFTIKAKSKKEAEFHVINNCGLVLGGNIHSNLSDEDVDWKFNHHPQKSINFQKIKDILSFDDYDEDQKLLMIKNIIEECN